MMTREDILKKVYEKAFDGKKTDINKSNFGFASDALVAILKDVSLDDIFSMISPKDIYDAFEDLVPDDFGTSKDVVEEALYRSIISGWL